MLIQRLPVLSTEITLPHSGAYFYLQYIADDGSLYISDRKWLYHFRDTLHPIYRISELKINRFKFINQQLWMLTNSGVHLFDIAQNKLDRVLFEGVNVNEVFSGYRAQHLAGDEQSGHLAGA